MDKIEYIIFITLLLHSGYCNKIILHKKKICTTDFALYLQSTEICTLLPNLYLRTRSRIQTWEPQTVAAVSSTFCCKNKIQLQIFIKYFPIFIIPTESCYSLTVYSFQITGSSSLSSLLKNGQIFWMVPI